MFLYQLILMVGFNQIDLTYLTFSSCLNQKLQTVADFKLSKNSDRHDNFANTDKHM